MKIETKSRFDVLARTTRPVEYSQGMGGDNLPGLLQQHVGLFDLDTPKRGADGVAQDAMLKPASAAYSGLERRQTDRRKKKAKACLTLAPASVEERVTGLMPWLEF